MQTYNPSVGFVASSPYTGEPIEVRTNLIQCHKLKPPLCKGRGTTSVVEGLLKSLCKAPEAAVQRRCGDHVSGGRVVNGCICYVIMR